MPPLPIRPGLRPVRTGVLPRGESERRVLVRRNLLPPALVQAMLVSSEGWKAAVSFY